MVETSTTYSHSRPLFHDLSKNFFVPLSQTVPGLSHVLGGTQKLLISLQLRSIFSPVLRIFDKNGFLWPITAQKGPVPALIAALALAAAGFIGFPARYLRDYQAGTGAEGRATAERVITGMHGVQR